MSLKEYRAKRDFTKSPEPAGSDETSSSRRDTRARFFCVQKHLATALHYDFRLEHNGVLLSWAVPKGPSLDPTVKRLAMHVEDHPIEYGTFEGVIPEGYGAGVVMLWDQGTWTPEQEDVDAALAKGDLKFTLDGYKLKGSWVLVRTRGWGGGKRGGGRGRDAGGGESGKTSWLLIKHRDDWAGPIDIATFAPRSVKSNGTFRDILTQEAPDLWHSNRAAAGKTGEAAMLKIVEKVIALEEEDAATAPEGAAALDDGAEVAATPTAKTPSRAGQTTARGKTRASSSSTAASAASAPSSSSAPSARSSSSARPASSAKPASAAKSSSSASSAGVSRGAADAGAETTESANKRPPAARAERGARTTRTARASKPAASAKKR